MRPIRLARCVKLLDLMYSSNRSDAKAQAKSLGVKRRSVFRFRQLIEEARNLCPPLSHWERARERANVVATLSSSLSLRAEGRAAREGEAPAEPGSLRGRCQQRRLGTGPVVSKEVVREESTGSPLVRSV
jgi:hypothetical protein